MELRGSMSKVVLTLLDRLRLLLEDSQKKEHCGNLYRFAVFHRFSTSYLMFLDYLAQQTAYPFDDLSGEGFDCLVGYAHEKGLIDEDDIDRFYILNAVYGAVYFYNPNFARNEDSLLRDIPQLITFMGCVVSTHKNKCGEGSQSTCT